MLDQQTPSQKDRRPRRRATRVLVFLAFAVVAALGAAVMLTRYMDARTAAMRVPTEKIVVAAMDISVATPIKAEWLAVTDWPIASRPEGAVNDPALVQGKVAVAPISKGEAILPSKLADSGSRAGLATLVPSSMRAVSVRVDDVIGVAGFVHPGDKVDVIVTMKPREDGDVPYVSKIILEDVKVLAVGKDIEHRGKDMEKSVPVTVATLMVTAEESERLALATTRGKILLALRGIGDEEIVQTRGITPPVLLASSVSEPSKPPPEKPRQTRPLPRKQAVASAPVQAAPPPEKQVVEILRGDLFEKRDFGPKEREKRP